ncbi:MAG: Sensor protein ZraS [Proteobacteria bacterium]|nr:Sensor protein ZraS [Pseudomonadota bacterium]
MNGQSPTDPQTSFTQVLHMMTEGVLGLDQTQHITSANRAAQNMLGWTVEELIGQKLHSLLQARRRDGSPYPENESPLAWLNVGGALYFIEDIFWRKDGSPLDVELSAALLPQPEHDTHAIVVLRDISDRKEIQANLLKAYKELDATSEDLEKAHSQLMQSEKMASVGQLAAGVAHEINNPIGFVYSNLGSLKAQVGNLLNVLNAYQKAEPALAGHSELLAAIEQVKLTADLEFLQDDIAKLVDESLDGIHRVKKIVDNLKNFSRVDTSEWQLADLEQGLESTLNIAWNEVKFKAEVIKEYAGLPEIECIAAQLNQVFLNLMVNAAQAIEGRGIITLRTGFDDKEVWVEVEDTGKGIHPEHLNKIFEPFFTTKPVGMGTGLGLSLAYGIVQRHHGRLEVRSELGKGTAFRVTLPRRRETQPDTAFRTDED